MPERLFTDDELLEMARPPAERFAACLDDEGDLASIEATWNEIEGAYRAFADGFDVWAATVVHDLTERRGPVAAAALFDVFAVIEGADAVGLVEHDRVIAARVGPPVPRPADRAEWLAAFAAMEAAWRRIHDVRVDRVAAMLSVIARAHGLDELEASLRATGDATLLARLERDVQRHIRDRVRHTVVGLGGNFATLRVEETDDEVVIVQDPCGTCGRQLERGMYEPDGPLAVVDEVSPVTFGRGTTPVYRCHVPVMHDIVPRERVGIPWPVIECPPGREVGPCRVRLAKDPFGDRPAPGL